MEETAAYVTAQDAEDEQQAVLDAARRAAQLHGELYTKLRGGATASAATGQSAREVARAANAEVLHATNAEVLDEDDFADFDDNEDASDPTDKQRALMASFVTTRRDRALHEFMAVEHQAHQEVRDMWHRAHQVTGEDMDLMARVTMGTVRARHQQEAWEAVTFHKAAAARTKAEEAAQRAH
jgi:hypothetical protein